MKKLLVLLTVLALAAPAMAGIDPGANGIGVYFDLEANANCAAPTAMGMLNMYLLATNINETSGISGWETHVYFNPAPPAGVTYTFAGTGAVNPLTAPDFQVGMGGGPLGAGVWSADWAPAGWRAGAPRGAGRAAMR